MSDAPESRGWIIRSITLVAGGAVLALGLWFVRFGGLNADEGFYLLATRLVSEGFAPYRDFAFTQPPALPWIYSVLLEVFGWDLAGIRFVGWTLVALTLGLGVFTMVRRQGWTGAMIFVVLLAASPGWLAFAVKGKTYALAGLAVMVGAMALVEAGSPWRRWMAFLAAAALGVMTRLPTVVFFAVGWVLLLIEVPALRLRLLGIVVSIIVTFALIWLGSAGAWEDARFWTVDLHRQVLSTRPAGQRWGGLLALAPAVGIGLLAITGAAVVTRRWTDARLSLAVLAAIMANVGTSGGYAEYATPFIPAGALAIALALHPLARQLAGDRRRWRVVLTGVTALAAGWLRPPVIDAEPIAAANSAAEFVRGAVPADKWVVASMPEIAVAAQRRVPLELAMGKFSFTESLNEADAARLHMVTPARLVELLEDPQCGAFVISVYEAWNFAWSLPQVVLTSQEAIDRLKRCVGVRFRVAFTSTEYVVLLPNEDSHASGE